MNMEYAEVNVRDWAAGDGVTDDTAALQRALDGGGKTVVIPDGVYLLSTSLKVFSHTRIHASSQATIRLADHAGKKQEDWLICNADRVNGNSDIEIDGGIWDANCQFNPRGEEYHPGAFAGVAVNFVKVNKLKLKNMTVCNPDSFFIRLGEIEDFQVENIQLFNLFTRINQDGVHVGGYCRRGLIRKIYAITPYTPNDDMVALNADDDVLRHFNQGMRCGPIEDILIEDIYADSAYTFIRMLSQDNPIRNIKITGLRGGARGNVLNLNRWRFPKGKGAISDILIRDVDIRKMPAHNTFPDSIESHPLCDIGLKVNNFVIEDFRRFPVDCKKASTVAIATGGANDLTIEGLDKSQLTQLAAVMPGAKVTVQDIAASGVDEIFLSEGGFKCLKLNCRFAS